MKKPIAIIPARGGSKRVNKKNITEINGKPLVCYAIDVCNDSGLFSKIYINSEDDEILNISESYGASVYKRPEELSGDTSSIIDTMKEMIISLEISSYHIGILLPTSPLRESDDLLNAWNIYDRGIKPVVSVCKYETPIQLAHYIGEDGALEPYFPNDYSRSTRSVGHRMSYRYNGAIIFNSAKKILEQKNLIGSSPLPYVMPEERSIDIDYPYQIEIIKSLLN